MELSTTRGEYYLLVHIRPDDSHPWLLLNMIDEGDATMTLEDMEEAIRHWDECNSAFCDAMTAVFKQEQPKDTTTMTFDEFLTESSKLIDESQRRGK